MFLCLTENLVPNIFLELFFVMQLLTSRSTHNHNADEQENLCTASSGVRLFFEIFWFWLWLELKLKISCLFFYDFRCSRAMLLETSTQLCVFCSEGSGVSFPVSSSLCCTTVSSKFSKNLRWHILSNFLILAYS